MNENFKELTGEEVSKLSVDEQVKYFNELNEFRAKKLENLEKQLKENTTKEVEKAIETLKSEIKSDNVKQLNTLQNAIEAQGTAIKSLMNEKGSKEIAKSIKELVADKSNDLLKVMSGELKNITLKVTRSSVTDSTLAMRLTDIGQLSTRVLKLRQLFNQASVGAGMNGVVRYVDQESVTRNASSLAEGSAALTSVITWIEKTLALQEIKDSIPVSRRSLTDVSFIESEIRNFLMKNMDLKIDSDLWNANGTAPNIKGIYTYATAWTNPTAGTIQSPTEYDVILEAQKQVEADTGYMANYALMNPTNYNTMISNKDANNNYIRPPFVLEQGGKLYVNGVEIVKTSAVTAGTMLIGDFTKATLYQGDNLTITIGEVSNQFKEGMLTMLATEQLGLLVRSAHEDAFIKITDITAAMASLSNV